MNLFIIYEFDTWLQDLNAYFTLKYFLFRSGKLTKNVHPDKCSYIGYGIGFDSHMF